MTQVPLGRLVKKRDVEDLLRHLQRIVLSVDIAILDASGNVYASTNDVENAGLSQGDRNGETAPGNYARQTVVIDNDVACELVCWGNKADVAIGFFHPYLEQLLRANKARRELTTETLERYREVNLLYRVGETIGRSLDEESIPRLLLDEARSVITYEIGVVFDANVQRIFESGIEGANTEGFFDLAKSVINQAANTVYPRIIDERLNDRPAALICAPIVGKNALHGFVVLGRIEMQDMYTAGDEKLLAAIVAQGAAALEISHLHQEQINHLLLQKELELGEEIQQSLLPPEAPQIPGWEFGIYYRAARRVGGDFYDFVHFPQHPEWLGLVIADVTGKGVPAAIYMALCRAIVRASARSIFSPKQVLQEANEAILEDSNVKLFTTLLYGVLNTKTGEVIFSNAGHDYPIYSSGAEYNFLEVNGFVLGAFHNIRLDEKAVMLHADDTLVLYTDGITEARNTAGEFFGDETLLKIVKSMSGCHASEVAETIISTVADFAGDRMQSDDYTLVVIKRADGGTHAQ